MLSCFVLQLLGLDYYLGKIHGKQTNLLVRRDHLVEAKACYLRYLKLCRTLRILNKDDRGAVDSDEEADEEFSRKRMLSPEEQRSQKIAKYKREKEAKERMQSLQRMLHRSRQEKLSRGGEGADEDDDDMEEESRQLMILQLQSYARDAQDELGMLEQEMVLLQHMAQLRSETGTGNGTADSNGKNGSSGSVAGSSSSRYPSVPGLPDRSPIPGGNGASQGLSVTKASKIGDQVILRYPLPSMR